MDFLFFFKPIADLLYKYTYLDVLLTLIVIYYLLKRQIKSFCSADFPIIILAILFVFSYMRNPSEEALKSMIKIESSFLLYFLGRAYFLKWRHNMNCLQIGFVVILLISLYSYVSGDGFKMWGRIKTFSSYYFFKTDAAAAFAQFIILFVFIRYKKFSKRIFQYAVIFVAFYLIVIANARAYYFVVAIVLGLWYLAHRERRSGKRIKINFKYVFGGVLLIIATLMVMNYFRVLGFGSDFLLISYGNGEELLSESNTQGRRVIWENILTYFFQQGTIDRLFGIDLITDAKLGVIAESHNNYIKILFTTGYVGICAFLFFLFETIRHINEVRIPLLFYVTTGLLVIYLVSGLSYSTILSTQLTWLPMYYIGVCVSYSEYIYKKRIYSYKTTIAKNGN